MPYRIFVLACVLFIALAFGSTSCASRTSPGTPTAHSQATAASHSEIPVVIIQDKTGKPLAEPVIYKLYCPCYAFYTDEVI